MRAARTAQRGRRTWHVQKLLGHPAFDQPTPSVPSAFATAPRLGYEFCESQWLACVHSRTAASMSPLPATSRLGVDADRCSLIVSDSHRLLLAVSPAHCEKCWAGRVKDWIAGRRGLPRETLSYVLIVTGRPAADWVDERPQPNSAAPKVVPCSVLAKSFIASTTSELDKNSSNKGNPGTQVTPVWGVQLVGSSSESAAMASFQQLQKAYRNILGARLPVLLQSRVGTTGHWYRVRIATNTRTEAEQLCSGLRAAGRDCLVQRN